MSTTTSQDQTVDYEHFIDYQLNRAQGRIKSVEVGTAMVRLITAAIAYVLAVVVLDHAIVLPSLVRLVLLLSALAAGSVFLVAAAVVPGVRRLNRFYAARTIEQATPEFQNSLINFLDLRRRPKEIPAGVMAALEERAVTDLSGIQVDDKIRQDTLVRASYGLAAAVLAACLAVLVNALFMHRSLADSLGRALLPTADIQPPTKTQITNVKPGDDNDLNSVVAHSDVVISALVEGKEPEKITLHWSDDGGKFWREQPLKPAGSKFDPWKTELALVEKPLDYYLEGGDCRTKSYRLNVTQAPAVTSVEVTYEYPEYTGWARYTSRDGNIDAIEGTTVSIVATTNRPARSGQIKFGPGKSSGPMMATVPGHDDQLATRFAVTRDDTYTIWFETDRGETNPRPATYSIKVRIDLPPTVQVKPGSDLVEPPVPANSIIPIGVSARDDFGIEQVTLHVAQGQETLKTFELTDGQIAGKEFSGTHRLDLAELRLAAGEEIAYWIDVADNRQPKRNHATSPRYRIKLGSPLNTDDRKNELARADDAAKAAEQPTENSSDRTQPQQGTEPGEQASNTEDGGQTPKDERALDVIRKFMEEKDRERQMEQGREPSQNTEGENRNAASQPDQSGAEKDAAGNSKSEQQKSGDDSKSDDPKKQDGEKQQGDKSQADKSGEKSDGEKGSGEKGGGKSGGEKGGNEKSGDKQTGDMPGGEKGDNSKSGGDKPGDDKASGNKGEGNDKAGGSDKAGGDKAGGEKTKGDKTGGENSPGDKQKGDKAGDENSSGEKMKGDKAGGEKPGGEGTDKQSGEKTKDDKAVGDKPNGDKPTGLGATGNKTDGEKPDGEKNSGKQSGEKSRGDAASDKSGDDKPPGDKAAGGSPSGDKQKGDNAANDKAGSDMPDDKSGEKAGGEKAGDDKSGGDKSEGQGTDNGKQGGDQSGQGASKQAGKGGASGKSGQGNSQGKAGTNSGGGSNASAGQTPQPQPGGGEPEKRGPVQETDGDSQPLPPEKPRPKYGDEGSDLVLDRLGKQIDKGEVDPDLLKRLGWSQEELDQFVKQFSGPGKTDGKLDADKLPPKSKKPAEPGKTTLTEKRTASAKRGPGQTAVDNLGDNFEGNRAKAPPEYEDLVRAYNMSQSKSDKPANPALAPKPR